MHPAGSFTIAPDHPALPGHFPGNPVIPGVVLLAEVLALLGAGAPLTLQTVRFLAPVHPGQPVTVHAQSSASGTRFIAQAGGQLVLRGSLAPAP